MKKKVFAVMMGIVLCAALFMGCGKAADDVSEAPGEAAGSMSEAPDVNVRVGSLKGPTSMGLVYLMSQSEAGGAEGSYTGCRARTGQCGECSV